MIDTLAQSEFALAGLFATAAVLVFLALWFTLVERDKSADRVKSVVERRLNRTAGPSQNANRSNTGMLEGMRRIANSLKLLQTEQTQKIAEKLMQAGYRGQESILYYLAAKLVLPFVFPILAFLMIVGGIFGPIQDMHMLITLVAATLFGFYLPDILLTNSAQKRQQQLQKDLPDALDLLVVCAEAGLSLDASLNRVSSELAETAPDMSGELALTAAELGILPERRTALQNFATRVNIPSIKGVVNTLIQTEKYGTPLSQALRVLSTEFRNERMMRAEEKAARLPAILTVPMIVFILPVLFIVLIGPAIIDIYDNFIQ